MEYLFLQHSLSFIRHRLLVLQFFQKINFIWILFLLQLLHGLIFWKQFLEHLVLLLQQYPLIVLRICWIDFLRMTKSFPLRVSSVNGTNSAVSCGFGHIYHGVIILDRSNNSVFLYWKICWNRQVLNKTWKASSPGFFLKIFNSFFESINIGLDHKLFFQLFVIGFCLFCSRIGKR